MQIQASRCHNLSHCGHCFQGRSTQEIDGLTPAGVSDSSITKAWVDFPSFIPTENPFTFRLLMFTKHQKTNEWLKIRKRHFASPENYWSITSFLCWKRHICGSQVVIFKVSLRTKIQEIWIQSQMFWSPFDDKYASTLSLFIDYERQRNMKSSLKQSTASTVRESNKRAEILEWDSNFRKSEVLSSDLGQFHVDRILGFFP